MGVNKKLSQKDVTQYVVEDLAAKVSEEKQALQRAKFSHAITTLDNPAGITAKRRNIARLLTEFNKRKKA
ncbi:MAG: 50S ribosomal protein L29 [Chitinophagales bacterium]|nr:50S ribosomal protein L29 [Chitinophagales bacterium]